ncbi:MAG: flagellar protein FlgN [Erythrobacter sp.]|nr:flagellar protein FlgN [Erythrobacter sp.]
MSELADKPMTAQLRQMLAVLDAERQALAALDLGALLASTAEKQALCAVLEAQAQPPVDAECAAMLEAARRQNEINRKVRNLLAANVAARLDRLTLSPGLYSAPLAQAR